MKFTYQDLLKKRNQVFKINEDLSYLLADLVKDLNINDLKDLYFDGYGRYDDSQQIFTLKFILVGTMVLPCSRTLKPVDYDFEIEDEVTYSFARTDNDEFIFVSGNEIDCYDLIYQELLCSKPTQIFAQDSKPVEISTKSEDDIDPRLAKLKDVFKN